MTFAAGGEVVGNWNDRTIKKKRKTGKIYGRNIKARR